ncbi:hypothetical protein BV898_16174 [Hypsibius exemplaris]|uniref:Uncharacterized protein n=1 Tax=Hypsibius exemplaris TaxID=2072580 RepID=A0A9X6NJR0_HYPEX|nr:hypothetical protein BV898_16174 [Hypsibius exemplaris]
MDSTIKFMLAQCLAILSVGVWLAYYKPPSTTPAAQCGIPLNPPAVSVEPLDLAGTRWVFAYYIGPPYQLPTAKNPYNHYEPVGSPIEGTPGGHAFNFTATLRAGPDFNCIGVYSAGYFNTDGQKNVLTWSQVFDVTRPIWATHRILHLDSRVEIWYQCYKSNVQTGVCEIPYIEACMGTNPNLLSATDRTAVLQTIDTVLAPYCYSSKDLLIGVHDDTLPECAGLVAPADHLKSLALFSQVAKP